MKSPPRPPVPRAPHRSLLALTLTLIVPLFLSCDRRAEMLANQEKARAVAAADPAPSALTPPEVDRIRRARMDFLQRKTTWKGDQAEQLMLLATNRDMLESSWREALKLDPGGELTKKTGESVADKNRRINEISEDFDQFTPEARRLWDHYEAEGWKTYLAAGSYIHPPPGTVLPPEHAIINFNRREGAKIDQLQEELKKLIKRRTEVIGRFPDKPPPAPTPEQLTQFKALDAEFAEVKAQITAAEEKISTLGADIRRRRTAWIAINWKGYTPELAAPPATP